MNINNPLVSICIPAYEYPEFLERCLLSVITQTYSNFEVIVTDDSSHNELENVVTKINDSRITYYKNSNPLGSPANWNKAISYAKGEFIKILHHDDWFFNTNSLLTFVTEIQVQNVDFIFSACINNFKNNKKIHSITNTYFRKIKLEPRTILFLNAVGAPSTTFFRKEIANAVQFDINTKWYVDMLFYVQIFSLGFRCGYITNPLVNITSESSNQVTHTTTGEHKVTEAIYAFNKYNLLNTSINCFLKLHIIELLNRYNIKSFANIITLNDYQKSKLATLLRVSKIPIPYKIFTLLRRVYINNLPFKINFPSS